MECKFNKKEYYAVITWIRQKAGAFRFWKLRLDQLHTVQVLRNWETSRSTLLFERKCHNTKTPFHYIILPPKQTQIT